jgi:hypothetical protein
MAIFDFEIKHTPKGVELFLAGKITEGANLQDIKIPENVPVIINLKGLVAINSLGVRDWVKWVGPVSKKYEVTFRNLPPFFVRQANILVGLVPSSATIESFFVTYFCETCNEERNVLFRRKLEFDGTDLNIPNDVKCGYPEHGPMSLDVPTSYFQFLKSRDLAR